MIRLLRRLLGLNDHTHVRHELETQEKKLRNNERRLEHLRRERALHRRGESPG